MASPITLVDCVLVSAILVSTPILVRVFNKGTRAVEQPLESYQVPVNHILSTLSIVVPTLLAMITVFLARGPRVDFASVIVAFLLLLLVLALSIWLSLSIARRADATKKVTLVWPQDRSILVGQGYIYLLSLVALGNLAYFVLAEVPSLASGSTRPIQTGAMVVLQRPLPLLGETNEQVLARLGQPDTGAGGVLEYRGADFTLLLRFDEQRRLQEIVQRATPTR